MGRSSPVSRRPEPVDLALFDASTLVGKGVKTHLRQRRFPVGEVRAFDTGVIEEGGNLTEFNGEAMLAGRPDLDAMSRVDLAFYCGAPGTGDGFLDWPERGGFTAIDLTCSANRKDGIPVVNAGVNPEVIRSRPGLVASPHPISQFLSTFLAPLARTLPLEEAVSLVMQPASEAGEEGIAELHQQTVGVLSFGEVPKERFDPVLAFNVMPAVGGPRSGTSEEWITREIHAILGGRPFLHTLRVVLVPVFHCHTFCCWVRFAHPVDQSGIRQALSSEPSLKIVEGSGAATPAQLTGEDGIHLQVRCDPAARNGVWFWGVTDNLAAGAALNAVRLAENLLSSGPLNRGRSA